MKSEKNRAFKGMEISNFGMCIITSCSYFTIIVYLSRLASHVKPLNTPS